MRTPLSLALAGLLLIGAGCGASSDTQVNVNASAGAKTNINGAAAVNAGVNANVSAGANANVNGNTNAPSGEGRELPPATGVDATWQTYNNTSLGFTFKAPTRGRYAPTWEVSFLAENDTRIQGGCYVTEQNESRLADLLRVNGVVFCRTFAREGAAGSISITQNVVTKQGARYILMSFTKKATNAGVLDCPTQPESGLSVSGDACIPFVMADFDAQIEQIVSTFVFTE